MASSKRERQLAREKYERQSERRALRAERARTRQRIIASVVVVALIGGGVAWVVATSRSDDEPSAAALASALASAMPSDSPSAASGVDPSAEPIGEEDCASPGELRADDISFGEPGDLSDPALATESAWLSFQTNCGDIVIETAPQLAPRTVQSMAFLAEQGFFDGTRCHRVTTEGIFVLQCGDPAGNGTGGPGYAVPDENLPAAGEANYPAGTVAMANAGPGTGGSQFFITYADTTLPPGYSIWGTVESGLDIVQRIAAAGVEGGATDGAPAQPVVIDRATVSAIPE